MPMAPVEEDHPIHGWLEGLTTEEAATASDRKPLQPPTTPRSQGFATLDLPFSHYDSPNSTFTLETSIFERHNTEVCEDDRLSVSTGASSVYSASDQPDTDSTKHRSSNVATTTNLAPHDESALGTPTESPPRDLVVNTEIPSLTKPMLVWVTSCLQCVLKGLPCDKTVPRCSRCLRCGEEGHCLLQFVPYHDSWTTPILVRFSSDDHQVTEEREEQQRELLKNWQSRVERRNWALPFVGKHSKAAIVHTIKGTFLRCQHNPTHPGRGEGRERHAMLELTSEAVRDARQVYTYTPV
ncbi:hypothetical protein EJ05DRAFT_92776 [Pseudovirgaria hyperparasitica]|uniref:Zn(2)-C6 fungal-type domain-containing protein n=1 Tax=Pseudovirgaria hyperparasitica TaxID=470096 RepID=A0A6A6W3M1_9PEZI|nr:uncharacterized protein EJ05DRAFT_92776 [Pseudovirgaria hyperparasitica]KAF2756187.1 hypothetical protein EJ05DRAFT_92776 [Pseudovirgaria hyperparasitica]